MKRLANYLNDTVITILANMDHSAHRNKMRIDYFSSKQKMFSFGSKLLDDNTQLPLL